jgi:hypothetical protein
MTLRLFAPVAVALVATLLGTPAEAQVPESGTLVVTVTPAATVFVDRNQVGMFESRSLVMPVGRYVITFNHPGYQPLRRTIDLAANEKKTLTIDLAEKGVPVPPDPNAPAPPVTPAAPSAKTGTSATTAKPSAPADVAAAPRESSLRVRVEPRAQVTIDGRMIGETSDLTVPVTPGLHIVQVVHPLYQPLQRTVTVKDGATAEVSINLALVGKKK